jgi:hypothetical protein
MENSKFENLVFSQPKKQYAITKKPVKYDNAIKFAQEIELSKNERVFCVVSGNFIFGDFIEEFMIKNKYRAKRMIVSSLGADQNNIDSLNTLLILNLVDKLDLILSLYFYGFQKNNMMKYIFDVMNNDKVNLTICDTHCKLVLIETHCGKFFTIHGSANLASSHNIEHFCIEESEELYNFNLEYQSLIIEKYKLTKKPLRGNKLWQTVTEKEKTETFIIQEGK